MQELQAGVAAESPVIFQLSKIALDDPALGHDLEGVQLSALGANFLAARYGDLHLEADQHFQSTESHCFDPKRVAIPTCLWER